MSVNVFGKRKHFWKNAVFGNVNVFGKRKHFWKNAVFGNVNVFGKRKHFWGNAVFGNVNVFGKRKHLLETQVFRILGIQTKVTFCGVFVKLIKSLKISYVNPIAIKLQERERKKGIPCRKEKGKRKKCVYRLRYFYRVHLS